MDATDERTPEALGDARAKPCVLVVDDDPVGLEILSRELGARGASVRCAQGVSEAAAKLRHVTCDVAVVSLKLPGRGGTELLRHIRRLYACVEVIVVAWPEEESVGVGAVEEGAFAYLLRPLDLQEIADAVWVAAESSAKRRQERVPERLARAESGVQRSLLGVPASGGTSQQR